MAQPTGLNVNDVVETTISLTATPAGFRNFDACMVLGTSDIINVVERRRQYAGLTDVAADFPTTSREYAFAQLFFAQVPQPDLLYIGRFAQNGTSGILQGASLTPAQRLLTLFTGVTNGAMTIVVDGTSRALTGLNFSGALNLNGVAAVIQAALITAGSTNTKVTWDAINLRFQVEAGTVGVTSSAGYAVSPSTGTDVSILLGLSVTPTSSGANANPPVPGVAPETALACISLFDQLFGDWYAVAFTATLADSDHISVAEYIEGASRTRVYGIGSENTEFYDSTRSDDLASILSTSNLSRTMVTYSSTTYGSIASLFGRFATIDYTGSDTTITLKFKQMPGVSAEYLTENQAATLDAKRVNYFAAYQNGASIIQQGVMVNGNFIDSRINADWLANYVQTNLFNLYMALPKVPQTDAGVNLQKANITASMQQGVVNGYLAAGVYNGPEFGSIFNGKFLPLGLEVYAPLVATQNETDRALRKSVPFQIAGKEAGSTHSANVAITINP